MACPSNIGDALEELLCPLCKKNEALDALIKLIMLQAKNTELIASEQSRQQLEHLNTELQHDIENLRAELNDVQEGIVQEDIELKNCWDEVEMQMQSFLDRAEKAEAALRTERQLVGMQALQAADFHYEKMMSSSERQNNDMIAYAIANQLQSTAFTDTADTNDDGVIVANSGSTPVGSSSNSSGGFGSPVAHGSADYDAIASSWSYDVDSVINKSTAESLLSVSSKNTANGHMDADYITNRKLPALSVSPASDESKHVNIAEEQHICKRDDAIYNTIEPVSATAGSAAPTAAAESDASHACTTGAEYYTITSSDSVDHGCERSVKCSVRIPTSRVVTSTPPTEGGHDYIETTVTTPSSVQCRNGTIQTPSSLEQCRQRLAERARKAADRLAASVSPQNRLQCTKTLRKTPTHRANRNTNVVHVVDFDDGLAAAVVAAARVGTKGECLNFSSQLAKEEDNNALLSQSFASSVPAKQETSSLRLSSASPVASIMTNNFNRISPQYNCQIKYPTGLKNTGPNMQSYAQQPMKSSRSHNIAKNSPIVSSLSARDTYQQRPDPYASICAEQSQQMIHMELMKSRRDLGVDEVNKLRSGETRQSELTESHEIPPALNIKSEQVPDAVFVDRPQSPDEGWGTFVSARMPKSSEDAWGGFVSAK